MIYESHTQIAAVETLLQNTKNIIKYFFNDDVTELIVNILDFNEAVKGLSNSETILAHLAMDIWANVTSTSITEITRTLDSKNYHNFIAALDILRGTNYAEAYKKYRARSGYTI